jgi:hypothetical protein
MVMQQILGRHKHSEDTVDDDEMCRIGDRNAVGSRVRGADRPVGIIGDWQMGGDSP